MQTLVKKILTTQSGLGVSLLRLVLGGIFFKAGAGKLFGWFGGIGIAGATEFFQSIGIPFPALNVYFVGTIEFLGGIALLLGLFTRLAAFPFVITMVVAIFTAHRDGDFYYPLVLLTGSIALLETGGGSLSLDRWIGRKEACDSCAPATS